MDSKKANSIQMKSFTFYPNLKISRSSLMLFFVSFGMFIFSLFFAPFYFSGDQSGYTDAYNSLFGLDLIDGWQAYSGHISGELIHFLIVWMASNLGLEKNFVMALANSILAYLIIRVFLQWRVSFYIALVVIFTNFYLLVLYFSAERLKFGYIFLMLSLLYSRKRILSIAFALTSVYAHSQQILIYTSILFSNVVTSFWHTFKTSKIKFKQIFSVIAVIIAAISVIHFLGEFILWKFKTYNSVVEENIFLIIWKPLILFVLTLRYSAAFLKIIPAFSILILATVLVGPDRVNMITYCFFMFYALQYKGGVNAGVAVTSFYFGIKSIYFILSVIETGQGFS
jgi:hypothetical protein